MSQSGIPAGSSDSGPLPGGGHWEYSDNGVTYSYTEYDADGTITHRDSGYLSRSPSQGFGDATRRINKAYQATQAAHPADLPPGENLGPLAADEVVIPGDFNGDGTPDFQQNDIDGDGVPNHQDRDIDGDGIHNYYDANPHRPDHAERRQRDRAAWGIGWSEIDDLAWGVLEGVKKAFGDTVEAVTSLPGQIVGAASWLWDRLNDPLGTAKAAGRGVVTGARAAWQAKRIAQELEWLAITDRPTLYKLVTGDTDDLAGKVSPELLGIATIAREVAGAVRELYDDWDSKSPAEQADILGKIFGYVAYNVAEGAAVAAVSAGVGLGAKALKSGKLAEGLAELIGKPQLAGRLKSALARLAHEFEIDQSTAVRNRQEFRGRQKKVAPNDFLESVPSVRNGEFNRWFNELTSEEFDAIWANPELRKIIEARLRHPGGLHEWHLVSRTPLFKRWGLTADQIKEMRTLIRNVRFKNPTGRHGGRGSTAAHNELLQIIDSSLNYDNFVRRLRIWAHYRLVGGADALPPGLRP